MPRLTRHRHKIKIRTAWKLIKWFVAVADFIVAHGVLVYDAIDAAAVLFAGSIFEQTWNISGFDVVRFFSFVACTGACGAFVGVYDEPGGAGVVLHINALGLRVAKVNRS